MVEFHCGFFFVEGNHEWQRTRFSCDCGTETLIFLRVSGIARQLHMHQCKISPTEHRQLYHACVWKEVAVMN